MARFATHRVHIAKTTNLSSRPRKIETLNGLARSNDHQEAARHRCRCNRITNDRLFFPFVSEFNVASTTLYQIYYNNNNRIMGLLIMIVEIINYGFLSCECRNVEELQVSEN